MNNRHLMNTKTNRNYLHTFLLSGMMVMMMIVLSVPFAHAQLNEGGKPLSMTLQSSETLSSVPFVTMDPVDVEALRKEDEINDFTPGIPYRFGQNLYVNLNPSNSGTWDVVKEEYQVWRLGIESPGARSINLMFDQYQLPEGAKLYIYDLNYEKVLGAFTHRNNQDDGQFATDLIYSDAIVIEYIQPEGVAFDGQLNLARVTHGYRGIGEYSDKGFGSSGSCNLNVACSESAGWEDQIRSTVMFVSGGSGFCTGTLINNTGQDGAPLVLGANHCFNNPGSVVFWFNWQSETCNNPSSSPDYDAMSGAVTLARNSASDFWLLELNQEIPAEYNPYFSGWNRTTDDSIEGYIVGIHHPSADIKKFSYMFDGVDASSYLGAPGSGTTHWRVGTWADGTTTEPGSSGSSLYDQNQRLIGQLHGGYAACGNTDPDWYGRLGVSWTGGGSESTRLSDWLDPFDSGVDVLDGFDPNVGVVDVDAQLSGIVSPSGSIDISETITPEVIIRNGGILDLEAATISYELNSGQSDSESWTGSLATSETETIQFTPLILGEGDYEITVTLEAAGDENLNNNERTQSFRVFDCSAAGNMPFMEDFTFTPECWGNVDNQGSGQVWSFGSNGNNGLPGSFGSYAYLDSDAFGSGSSQNADLITPSIDLTLYSGVTLSFDHFYRHYSGSSATVSYSVDGGDSWTDLASWTADSGNPENYSVAVPEADGQQVLFKWNYTGSFGWYWSVDNISVEGEFTGSENYLTVDVPYNSGWNLIGLPVEVNHSGETDLFPNAIDGTLFGFDGSYNPMNEMMMGHGYWLRFLNEGMETFSGFAYDTLSFQVRDGWNLISGHGKCEPLCGFIDPDDLLVEGSLFEFDGSYNPVSGIESGHGYWVNASDAGTVEFMPMPSASQSSISGTGGVSGAGAVSGLGEIDFSGFSSLTLSAERVEAGVDAPSQTLYFGAAFAEGITETNVMMPPVPPAGALDARFANGTRAQEGTQMHILVQQTGEPLTLSLIGDQTYTVELYEGDLFLSQHTIDAKSTISIGEAVTQMIVSPMQGENTELPDTYVLDQNYPNPFNPSTMIRFALPEASVVQLDVFNITGQFVGRLANGSMGAGWHSVEFDASTLSSGIYLYRLTAGEQTITRKMMLVK